MPSLVFPISSLPRSFGGLLFGVLKIFNVDNQPVLVVPEYSTPPPTKTTPIYLPPTRCIPGPSSSPSEFPDTALLGLIAAIIIGFVYIICTRFDASPPETRPPPPPKPKKLRPTSSSSTRDPWSQVIWAYLAIIVFGTPIAHHLYFDKPRLIGDLGTQMMLMVEKAFLKAWDSVESLFSVNIVPHWRQYLKIGFHTFTGHSLGLLPFFIYRRFYGPVVRILQTPAPTWFSLPWIVPVALFASTSKLSWILWFTYCSMVNKHPSLQAMHNWLLRLPSAICSLIGTTHSLDIWMIFGPFSLNIAMLALLTVVLTIHGIPWALRTIHRHQHFIRYILRLETIMVALMTCFWGIYLPVLMFWFQYRHWPTESRRLWQSIYCPEARAETKRMLRALLESNLRFKEERIREFSTHGRELRHELWEAIGVCMETWRTLHLIQKLLIVIPIAILCLQFVVGGTAGVSGVEAEFELPVSMTYTLFLSLFAF
ncbi:hypothetical protein FB45DRAFT_1096905 [Roridomyces roridus]|uniref:Uncharacterized protein n=1 Tax=Roridomyces roridus TaxID=1738132 RepID=A0AAD7BED5_9AGAR|nr:hypothetical protein FB45DRAFT_1096905 [Roridomyces roridus]